MRLCFFSDIHGNLLAFESFLKQSACQDIDDYIFGGDVMGYYYHPDEIIDIFCRNKINCILGNHDRMYLDVLDGKIGEKELIVKYGNSYLDCANKLKRENMEFLRSLPLSRFLDIDGLRLAFFHGGPDDPLNQRIYPDVDVNTLNYIEGYDYIFTGHTHHKMVLKGKGGSVINPGSLGQQRDGKGCSYVIFDTRSCQLDFFTIEYDIASLKNEIDFYEDDFDMIGKLKEVLERSRE